MRRSLRRRSRPAAPSTMSVAVITPKTVGSGLLREEETSWASAGPRVLADPDAVGPGVPPVAAVAGAEVPTVGVVLWVARAEVVDGCDVLDPADRLEPFEVVPALAPPVLGVGEECEVPPDEPGGRMEVPVLTQVAHSSAQSFVDPGPNSSMFKSSPLSFGAIDPEKL